MITQLYKYINESIAKIPLRIVEKVSVFINRWWEQTSLGEKLPFARARVVESYIMTIIGPLQLDQCGYNSRIMCSKANCLVTVIDDMFDVYGTLQELQLFNDTIRR